MNDLKIIHYKHFWQALGLLVADSVFFSRTNAAQVAPVLLIIGFILLVLTCYILIYAFLGFARLYGLPIRYKHRFAVYLSGVTGLIVALQSIGELTPRDILVLLPLVALGYAYTVYTTAHKRNLDG